MPVAGEIDMNGDTPGKPATMVLADAAMDVIHRLRQQGITTAADLARALNERDITTPRGDRWHAMQVQRVIATGMTRA
jgi:hypothetical protein